MKTTTPSSLNSEERQSYALKAEEELRIEVSEGVQVQITLQSGDAEINGLELAKNKAYTFTDVKLPIFTWHGCSLTVVGKTDIAYTASETPMPIYANAFSVLYQRRQAAAALPSPAIGPRVLILGPPDSGKTTLSQLMLTYAVKTSKKILYANLDISSSTVMPEGETLQTQHTLWISMPGCIGASSISHVEIEEGPLFEAPLSFYYGHLDPMTNMKELERLVGRLGEVVKLKTAEDLRGSGYIATTGGWVEECGREFIGSIIRSMKADVVFVIGAERMYADVTQVVGKEPTIEVVHLPRSGGVVRRDVNTRRKDISRGYRNYFYGTNSELNPFTIVVDFADVTLLRVGGGPAVPASALPIGAESTLDPLRIAHVTIQTDLIRSILGVSQAKEEQDVPNSALAGYVHVTKVEVEKRKLTILAPSPGRLPYRYLLVGTLKWLE